MAEGQNTDPLENVAINDLIEAVNDPAKAEALMEKHGWTREQLLARADLVAKRLAARIAYVAVV